ncbi:hypothetical protein [Falsihalocynthiibacter sp. CO-5D18]|uniref:hypothetical protein n=1 Tax=Falsihalocynthiibacter sp. CO-5D18 TaxID=3240872 RepID=UPI00350F4DA4
MEQFSETERATLASVADMFAVKKDRDDFRELVRSGATVREMVLAYRTQKRMISTLKAVASLIAVLGAAYAALKQFGVFPKL